MKAENVKAEEPKRSEEELIDLKVDDEQVVELKGGIRGIVIAATTDNNRIA